MNADSRQTDFCMLGRAGGEIKGAEPMRILPSKTASDRNAIALTGLRIAVGCLFLIFGQYKVFGTQFTLHGDFQFWIGRFLKEGAYPFMVPVLDRFVLSHATPIAFLVAYGELAIGLALVLGVWVRPASAFGFIYMLSLLFSSNYPGAHVPLWQYFGASLDHSVLALCFLAFIVGESDDLISLKKYRLGKRHPAIAESPGRVGDR
jgi:uncharacterized membrane protein YphA (DoxX/SURF4 family)